MSGCKNSSNSSKGLGNTIPTPISKKKQISPSKKWCFTLNNYSESDISSIRSIIQETCKYGTFGREIGAENNTPHLQGYVEFIEKRRPMSVFKMFDKIHWEKARGTRQDSIRYCSKEDRNPFVHPAPYKVEIELRNWQRDLIDYLSGDPDDRTIKWVWEPDGCAGKTTFQKYVFTHYENVVILSGKGHDMKNGIVQYEDKHGNLPKIVLINIPRVMSGFVSISGIEEIKDMFFFSGKYEGGMVCGPSPHVLVFANSEPPYEKMSADRWDVTRLTPA